MMTVPVRKRRKMLMAGNPKVFGPVFCTFLAICMTFVGAAILYYSRTSFEISNAFNNENILLAIGLFGLSLLNLGSVYFDRIFKPLLLIPAIAYVAATMCSMTQQFETNIIVLPLLFLFTFVSSLITIAAKQIEVTKVSKLGIYEVSFKNRR